MLIDTFPLLVDPVRFPAVTQGNPPWQRPPYLHQLWSTSYHRLVFVNDDICQGIAVADFTALPLNATIPTELAKVSTLSYLSFSSAGMIGTYPVRTFTMVDQIRNYSN